MIDRCIGVILAGGKSSRMGTNKALMPWHGARLVDYIAHVLLQSDISEIYVSGQIEGFPSIIDLVPEKGPVGGICSSLRELKNSTENVLFVPVDMPLLSPSCLLRLRHSDPQFDVCHFQQHPLPALVRLNERVMNHVSAIKVMLQEREGISVKEFFRGLSVQTLEFDATCTHDLTNTNTPEEWKQLYELTN